MILVDPIDKLVPRCHALLWSTVWAWPDLLCSVDLAEGGHSCDADNKLEFIIIIIIIIGVYYYYYP